MNANNGAHSPQDAERRLLERATQKELPSGTELDAETAELREVWLDWGRRLEQAETAFDADAFLSRLQLPDEPGEPLPGAQPARTWGWWASLGIGAALLAASLLIAIRLGPIRFEEAGAPSTVAVSAPESATDDGVAVSPPIAHENVWDDDLDRQFEQVELSVSHARSGLTHFDASYANLQNQLRQFEEDLADSSL